MLGWIYDILVSIVTYILGLLGITKSDKKHVSFADDNNDVDTQNIHPEETNNTH